MLDHPQKAKEAEESQKKKEEAETKSYKVLQDQDKMISNKDNKNLEDDFW
jgi:hypothetical protein